MFLIGVSEELAPHRHGGFLLRCGNFKSRMIQCVFGGGTSHRILGYFMVRFVCQFVGSTPSYASHLINNSRKSLAGSGCQCFISLHLVPAHPSTHKQLYTGFSYSALLFLYSRLSSERGPVPIVNTNKPYIYVGCPESIRPF